MASGISSVSTGAVEMAPGAPVVRYVLPGFVKVLVLSGHTYSAYLVHARHTI